MKLLESSAQADSSAKATTPPTRRLRTTQSLDGRGLDQKHRSVLRPHLREKALSPSEDDCPPTPSAMTTLLQQELFPPKHLFTVTVGRSQSCARYSVGVRTLTLICDLALSAELCTCLWSGAISA